MNERDFTELHRLQFPEQCDVKVLKIEPGPFEFNDMCHAGNLSDKSELAKANST